MNVVTRRRKPSRRYMTDGSGFGKEGGLDLRKYYGFAIMIIVIALLGCGTQGTSSTPSANLIFSNQEYHVSLQYPSTWKANKAYSSPERYEGNNGLFQISAFDGEGWTIDQVAEWHANHKLKPFGTTPSITKLEILGKEVCLIKPSVDQPKEEKDAAELIVKYPKPIQINMDKYSYLVLWADQQHIEEIGKTINFID